MTSKLKFLIPCLMLSMVSFTSCSDDDNNGDGPSGGGSEPLTSEQSKEKLSAIGQNLIGLVNAEDQRELIELGDYFSDIAGSLEIQEKDHVQKAIRTIVAASQGDMAAVYRLASPNGEVYQASDYYGIYNYVDGEWKYEPDQMNNKLAIMFEFDGKAANILITATGDEKDIIYDDVTVKVPAKISATIELGTKTLTSIDITTANVSNTPREADITVNVDASGYKVSSSVSAGPSQVKANYLISIKGTEAVKGEAYLNGTNMTADEGKNENIEDRFNDAQAQANIMGEALVTLKCESYKELARKMEAVEDQYDNEAEMWGNSQAAAQAMSDVYKQYLIGALTFNGSDHPSASLAFQPGIDYSYTDGQGMKHEYWDTEVLLQFEDESLISFEKYFDAASGPFKSLANSFEALVDSFDGFITKD